MSPFQPRFGKTFARAAFRLSLALTFVAAALAHTAYARQTPAPQTLRLSEIRFEGLERVKEAEALEKVGLKTGEGVTIDAVEEAANRLVQSGLFKDLSYSIRGTTEAAALTFKVKEMAWGMPVVFDNFIWFTEDELRAAVKRKVPAFDGTAPESGAVTDAITRALQDLLRERKIEGAVEYGINSDPSGKNAEHLFTVKGAGLRVCRLSFPGARAFSEEALVQKSGGIFDNEYSRKYVSGFAENTLLPLYHERGHLRAGFLPPQVKPGSTAECENGLAVTIPVNEGPIYVFQGAEWSGNQALTPQELNAALGMRQREVANAVKLERGFEGVRRAYGRKGHLTARLRAVSEFDEAARSVSYRVQVEEGPQYRMGELVIKGLSEKDTNNVRGRWRLLPGEVYDAGYIDEFARRGMQEFAKDLLREGRKPEFTKIERDVRPDREKLTVDVTLDFKQGTPPAPAP